MKKTLAMAVLIVLLCVTGTFGAEWLFPSGSKSADTQIYSGPGYFGGIAIVTDGTTPVTVSIYDSASGTSATLLVPTFPATTSATDRTKSFFVYPLIHFNAGIYVDVTVPTGGTVGFEVYYTQ